MLEKEPYLLLGKKKRGFGEGRWNGFGGKVEEGETIEDAARREFFEEAGIVVHDLEKRGEILFRFENDPTALEVHIFRAEGYQGEPTETEEMQPVWFHKNEIPFDDMWPDDRHWFPLFFAGKKFQGEIFFQDQNTILTNNLKEVSEFGAPLIQ